MFRKIKERYDARRAKELAASLQRLTTEYFSLIDGLPEEYADAIRQHSVTQQLIDSQPRIRDLTQKKVNQCFKELENLSGQVATAKHESYERNANRFQQFYQLVYDKYCKPLSGWELRFGSRAAFCYKGVELKFGYNETSFLTSITVMKTIAEHAAEFNAGVAAKAKTGVTSPSTNFDIAFRQTSQEWRESLLALIGLTSKSLDL